MLSIPAIAAARRKLIRPVLLAAAIGGLTLGLAACSSDDDLDSTAPSGSPFTQALFKDYSDLAHQAASLPAAPAADKDEGFFDSLNPFSSDDGDTSANDLLSKAFTNKAQLAAAGTEPDPEAAPDQVAGAIRARLVRAVAASKEQAPDAAARAEADYDCWILYGAVPSAAAASQACKSSLDSSLVQLEGAGHPAPAATAPVPAPIPAPAPVSAPAPAPVTSNFTVYFEFDSWTLTAEDLTVLTNVINTARSGGQGNIEIVGHTDTSGSAEYNQKLSVHRANVVVEALVDMGARRQALHASGVGETDLAVETGDNVKEAKNRRTVINLKP